MGEIDIMKYMSILFSILITSTVFTSLYPGADVVESTKIQESEWSQVYEIPGTQDILALDLTSDQGYILAGWSSNDRTAFMIKTDSLGNKIWNFTYDGGGNKAEAYDVLESSDGGYVFTGNVENGMFILKTDASGIILWEKVHTLGDDTEWGKSIVEVSDGFVIMGLSGNYIWLLKTDKTGNLLWQRTYGKSSERGDSGKSLLQTADSGFIMTGITYSYDRGNGDVWVIKTDENGMEQWNMTYGGNGYDMGSDVIETRDGYYIIVGGIKPTGKSWRDAFIMKIDTQGNEIWTKLYGGSDLDVATSVIQTADGLYVLTATTQSYGLSPAGGCEAWVLKLDEEGDMIWNKTIGGRESDVFWDMIEAADGSFILAGGTESFGIKGKDAWLVQCEDYPPPELTLFDPEENNLYIGDLKLISCEDTIVLGKKTIEVSVIDPDERMQFVEFYVESSFGTLYEHQVLTDPYRWIFDERIAGYCYLGVAGYYSSNGAHVAAGLFPWMFNI